MTATHNFSRLAGMVTDLTEAMPRERRYERLLDAFRASFPCDAIALLELDGDVTLPQRMVTLREAVDDFRRQLIADRLETYGGNCADAARSLGLDRGDFHRLLKKLGVRG